MDLVTPLLTIMSKQAGVDGQQLQNEAARQKIQMNQKAMAQQDTINAMMQRRAAGTKPDGSPKSEVPDMVTMDDGTMIPANANNPLVQVLKNISHNVERATQDADDANYYGDPKLKQTAEKELFDQQKELRLAQAELYKDAQQRNKEAAQAFGGVRNKADYEAALQAVKDNISPAEADKVAAQVAKTIPDYKKATDDEIRAAVAPISNRFASIGDQMRKASADQASQDRRSTLEETIRRDYVNERNQVAGQVLKREGLDQRERVIESNAGVKDQKSIFKEEDNAQKDLNKDKSVDSFFKVKKSFDSAKNVADVLAKNGFRSVTGAEANTLMTEYTQMTNNYRSMVGGKWTEAQRKNFDSMLSKAQGFFQSIGEGKLYSPEALNGVVAEMNRMYQDTNIEVVKKTLTARDKVWRRQGDPSVISSPGSIEQALQQPGVDKVVDPDTGNQIIRFGPHAEDWFVIRDKPKPRPKTYDFGDEEE